MINKSLTQGFVTGLLDKTVNSEIRYQPKLVQNNYPVEKVIDTFEQELSQCKSFWFTSAFLTMSGICELYSLLESLKQRGIKGKVLVSQYLNFTQPTALKRLIAYDNIEVRIDTQNALHGKTYLFEHEDHVSVLIGSSNLTANALAANEENNVLIKGLANSKVISDIYAKKHTLFNNAQPITDEYLVEYTKTYHLQIAVQKKNPAQENHFTHAPSPNVMQREALANLSALRAKNISKALLISATGTGKTYLSAFDVRNSGAKSMLFIVHRENILLDAQKTFQTIFGPSFNSTLFTGKSKNIADTPYVFATIQSLARDHHLAQFKADEFDYIVIDETHRAGSDSYLKVINYFKPRFLLGMTATPERSDGYDIFKAFDYNLAYEIRLKKAMEAKLICPFHYFGISDITLDGRPIDEKSDFSLLVRDERVRKIKEASEKFGTDSGELRALVFCAGREEAYVLAEKMTQLGIKSVALSGSDSIDKRVAAIASISSENTDRYRMIFTVDIFNEGIDIPKINQIILLRATESAIIYVQQLGRGLRKSVGKEYLTVIDFIGHYEKNFLIPMALFGDTSFNKDKLRKLVTSGTTELPGASSIHFDEIAKERIFQSINHSNFQARKALIEDLKSLALRLGHLPMMTDFLACNFRDPIAYVNYSKSYYSFIKSLKIYHLPVFSLMEEEILCFLSQEINNAKRVHESLLLKHLINTPSHTLSILDYSAILRREYGLSLSNEDIQSIVTNLNMQFNPTKYFKDNGAVTLITLPHQAFVATDLFKSIITNSDFAKYLVDNIDYALEKYASTFDMDNFAGGFIYYEKYSRKDVFRILNWSANQNPQNVGGYMASKDRTNCPIFVTYHKAADISETTKYEDKFVNPQCLQWMSKSKRKLSSPDVQIIINAQQAGTLLPLFVKKDDDEGTDFYFIGLLRYQPESAQETMMKSEKGNVSVVNMLFEIDREIDVKLYQYLVNG